MATRVIWGGVLAGECYPWEKDFDAIERIRVFKGVLIIVTNEIDAKKLPAEQFLEVYKAQGTTVEGGLRFLKDPMFYAERLYLNVDLFLRFQGFDIISVAKGGCPKEWQPHNYQ